MSLFGGCAFEFWMLHPLWDIWSILKCGQHTTLLDLVINLWSPRVLLGWHGIRDEAEQKHMQFEEPHMFKNLLGRKTRPGISQGFLTANLKSANRPPNCGCRAQQTSRDTLWSRMSSLIPGYVFRENTWEDAGSVSVIPGCAACGAGRFCR